MIRGGDRTYPGALLTGSIEGTIVTQAARGERRGIGKKKSTSQVFCSWPIDGEVYRMAQGGFNTDGFFLHVVLTHGFL